MATWPATAPPSPTPTCSTAQVPAPATTTTTTTTETRHGDHGHDDHAGPHESPWRITAPLVILGFLSIFSGYLLAAGAPFKTEYFLEWVEPRGVEVDDVVFHASGEASGHDDTEEAVAVTEIVFEGGTFGRAAPLPAAESGGEKGELAGCGFDAPTDGVCFAPKVPHAEFKWSKAMISIALVSFGIGLSAWLCLGIYSDRRNPFRGLTQRSRVARAGHQFLVNKLYLDDLYEKVIVRGIAHPISDAAYWVNQHIIDGVVDGTGRRTKRTGDWVYRNIDQRVVDGAVNASGTVADESGHALQPVQSGKVNQYGALLFAAATVGAIVLILTNV